MIPDYICRYTLAQAIKYLFFGDKYKPQLMLIMSSGFSDLAGVETIEILSPFKKFQDKENMHQLANSPEAADTMCINDEKLQLMLKGTEK